MNFKKILAGALAGTMMIASAAVVSAETATKDTDFGDGIVVDGSAGWNSAGSGLTFPITEAGVTVTFNNEPFIRSTANWDNFVFETIATDAAAGISLRADAWAWTYGDNTDNVPTWEVTTSWGTGDAFDNAVFQAASPGEVKLTAKKASSSTVTFSILFHDGATEVYTVTYPAGVPDGLEFQIGADGGKVTLLSAEFGEEPTAGGDDAYTEEWQVAILGFTTAWGGWGAVTSEKGVLSLETTIGAVMAENGIDSMDDFGGILFQVWGSKEGDVISYEITVGDVLDKSGTATIGLNDKGELDPSIGQYQTPGAWGEYEFGADDVINAKVTFIENIPPSSSDDEGEGEGEGDGEGEGEGEGSGDTEGEDKNEVTGGETIVSEDKTVTVTAGEGVTLPEGTKVEVKAEEVKEGDKQAVFEISLVDAEGKPVELKEGEKVTVTLEIPEELKGAEKYYVYYKNDEGKIVEKFEATLNNDGTVSFVTTHFSAYVLSTEEIPLDNGTGDTDNVPGGDKNQPTGVVLAIVPVIAAAAGVIISKKRK